MIKVQDVINTNYRVPDLDRMEKFLLDFGMVRARRDENMLYMRGAGPLPYITSVEKGDPAFISCSLGVNSMAELEEAAKLPGSSGIQDLDAPGGGKRVCVKGPDGHRVDLIFGQQPAEPLKDVRGPLKVNFAQEKNRVFALQRPAIEPARVFRIGHCVFKVSNADEAVKWFRDTLGMLVTDRIHVPDNAGVTLGTFLRCNKGKNPADHHSILCLQSTPDDIKVHHSSYEVQDPDAVHIGHYYLKQGGYNNEWGVGRHLLGSQVFDYWRDPWGHMFEHYADGDLLDDTAVPGDYPATQENLAQWGPEVSPTFFN
jgi:catechol 2,3-dioxygenase-like lactoylglutathione lyase family enzyme